MKSENRKKLEDFLNGKTDKLTLSSTLSPALIVIDTLLAKENFAQIFGWGETVEIPISEIDECLSKIPKSQIGIILDFARPITAEEIEAEQSKNGR